MMGKRLKEIFGLILINITLVSGSLNAETVYADTQAKIEIEKTEMPLKICVSVQNVFRSDERQNNISHYA